MRPYFYRTPDELYTAYCTPSPLNVPVLAHARLRLSRLELIGGSGRTARRPLRICRARLHFADRLRSSRRGEALWERVEAGSGSPGAASSESAAGSGRLRACGCSAAVLAAVESVAVFVRVCVVGFGWMVVRFVRVIRVPACARVSRVCPGSPRCLFTGTRVSRVSRVCPGSPRCLFTCVSRLPPVSFYRYRYTSRDNTHA